ncbi:hypothetical protein L1785_13905 [Antribacter sp. KLBMP9083]|uniref:Uncharacterized protein n=1 Tax=Antribacter soli TaxID=2910976 RepID=A0AA41QEQ1_9MICO|nr:hypothetical protein [Antribacter soli]MCF4122073.1 hypothetical protein [Antribacter soli]
MLPYAARERVAMVLREVRNSRPLRARHTLPIEAGPWGSYSDGLVERLREVAAGLEAVPIHASFGNLNKHVESVVATRNSALSALYALEPFAPFDHVVGDRVLRALDISLAQTATALAAGVEPPRPSDLLKICDEWPRRLHAGTEVNLSTLYGLAEEPVDDIGDLKPGWVLEAYKYDAARLLNQLAPHLSALGLPPTSDCLAMTSLVGWIAGAPDPVVAYVSMDSLTKGLATASPELADQVMGYFRQRERGRLQARRRILRTITSAADSDAEARALAAADIYRRFVEGPVRQFGWALRCLHVGAWSVPPTLGRVRDAMLGGGTLARRIAEDAVLVSMRNGEAHEDLEWDGVRNHYVVDGEAIEYERVVAASVTSLSFDRGCEAALAFHRASRRPLRAAVYTPIADDPFSMSRWERAEAYFGSNGLRAVRTELNGRTARVWLARLEFEHINPCFQALMSAHQLLPEVEAFEVYVVGSDECRIGVPANALSVNLSVWTQALEAFDRMPVETFLPTNFAARSSVEPVSRAARSVAWMAADGVLDALDGGPEALDESDVTLLTDRLRLAEEAIEQCLRLIPSTGQTRLMAVRAAVGQVLDALPELGTRPLDIAVVDALPPVQRIRHSWSVWGPVKRHPSVSEPPRPAPVVEDLPGRRRTGLRMHL